MKEIAKDFKQIAKGDKWLFAWMAANFLMSLRLLVLAFANIDSSRTKVIVGYSDINGGYIQGEWWYLTSFALLAVILGVGHSLIAARFYTKRSKAVARLVLGVSIAISFLAAFALKSIVNKG